MSRHPQHQHHLVPSHHLPFSVPASSSASAGGSSAAAGGHGHHHGHGQPASGPIEMENQFILRLPAEPASALREALRLGAGNIRERLYVQMEPDKNASAGGGSGGSGGSGGNNAHLRKGHVRFDGWSMSAKMVDLPTIIESQKTIDRKTFYKTADICQMLVCKEGEHSDDEEKEAEAAAAAAAAAAANKNKNKKVDKKYVWQHGICPPLKNCRKRRFRKTLRKKCVEAPEIEKEVKRLLRVDNEAVEVRYDLVTEEELSANKPGSSNAGSSNAGAAAVNLDDTSNTAGGIDEQDLFGALSDSDDDHDHDRERQDIDIDSEDADSNMFEGAGASASASVSAAGAAAGSSSGSAPTQFSKEMFSSPLKSSSNEPSPAKPSSMLPPGGVGVAGDDTPTKPGTDAVALKLEALGQEIEQLKTKKVELERNIANCDNQALQRRFEMSLHEVSAELNDKEAEKDDLSLFSGM